MGERWNAASSSESVKPELLAPGLLTLGRHCWNLLWKPSVRCKSGPLEEEVRAFENWATQKSKPSADFSQWALPCLFPKAVNSQWFRDRLCLSLMLTYHFDFLTPLLVLLPSCFFSHPWCSCSSRDKGPGRVYEPGNNHIKNKAISALVLFVSLRGDVFWFPKQRDWAQSFCRFSDCQTLPKHKCIFFKCK